jgi:hypothetical protein
MSKHDPWLICPACKGEGSHVNPNIYAGGISAEDFYDDPDFFDDYMSGMYDVPCDACHGPGKVRESRMKELREQAADRRLAAREDGDFEGYLVAGDWRYSY